MPEKIVYIWLSIILAGCLSKNKHKFPDYIKNRENLIVYADNIQPEYSIRLKQELHIGNTENNIIGRLGSFVVDSTGRIFIGDTGKQNFQVFHPDGSYITSIGREGRGPGEFISGPSLNIISDQLYAFDFIQFRLSIYSLNSLKLVRTLKLNPRNLFSIKELANFYPAWIFPRNDSNFLVLFNQPIQANPDLPAYNADSLYHLYYLMDNEGRIISDRILKQRARIHLSASINNEYRSATGFPFVDKSLIAVSVDGHIFSAWSEDFLVEVHAPDGEYMYAFYYHYNNVKLNRNSALKSTDIEYRQSIIQRADLPENWPALNKMIVDDENRLWISTIIDDFEVYQWWVLDATDGNLLARFTWPRDKAIEVIRNGKLYTRETEQETGLEEIIRYGINMGEKE